MEIAEKWQKLQKNRGKIAENWEPQFPLHQCQERGMLVSQAPPFRDTLAGWLAGRLAEVTWLNDEMNDDDDDIVDDYEGKQFLYLWLFSSAQGTLHTP